MVKSVALLPFGHPYSLLDCNPRLVCFLTYNPSQVFHGAEARQSTIQLVECSEKVEYQKDQTFSPGIGPTIVSEREKLSIHPEELTNG